MGLFSSETIVTPNLISPTITNMTLAGTVEATAITASTTLAVTGASTLTGGIVGTTAVGNATAGNVGEVISALKAVGAPVSIATTNTPVNVLTLSLTAGDWDVSGNVNFTAGSATTAATAGFAAGITLTTATIPVDGSEVDLLIPALTTTSFLAGTSVPRKRINVSTTTNVYLVANANFSAGTVGAYGAIIARRVR